MIILQDFQNHFELCNNLAQLLSNFEKLNNKYKTMFTKRYKGGYMKLKEKEKSELFMTRILNEVLAAFETEGILHSVGRYGHGHINDTYLVVFQTEISVKRYILQRNSFGKRTWK